jgi:hypothetical protein
MGVLAMQKVMSYMRRAAIARRRQSAWSQNQSLSAVAKSPDEKVADYKYRAR